MFEATRLSSVPQLPNDRRFAELAISAGAVILSISFSIIHLIFDPLLNPDGVIYLLAAQAWLDQGYGAAAAIYPLPVYSVLIASVHSISGASLLMSAHGLDAALIAALIVGLQRLAAALGGGLRVQALVVVLALLVPELNGFRSFLLRDFAYWMFATFALVSLVRHAIAPSWTRAAAFAVCCGVAAAFRAEAIPLLLVTPFALLWRATGKRTFPMVATCVLAAAGSMTLLYVVGSDPLSTTWFAQSLRQGVDMAAAVPAQIDTQITGFATHVLDPRFHDYAAFGVVGGLATMVVVHLVNAGSLPLTTIAIVGLATGGVRHMDRRGTPIIVVAFGVTVVSLVALLMARGIIQTRYAMPAGLLIVVCAAFVIDHWYARARVAGSWLRWVTPLLAVYLLGEAAFGLFNSKHHYVDAARWLAQHTARDARVFSNDVRVVYMAGRKVDWRDANVLSPNAVAQAGTVYDFWVMNTGRGGTATDTLANARGMARVAQFTNKKGQTMSIYSASSPTIEAGRVR